MSQGINKVILIGHLGADPEIRYMPNGNAVANFNLATSESWRDKQTGEKRERTEWHRIVIFNKLAEIAGEYLRKGSQVYVEGSLRTRKWQAQDGQDRYTTEIHIGMGGVMRMLSSAQKGSQPTQGGQANQGNSNQHRAPQRQPQGPQQNQGSNRQQSAPPQYNEPPMDFDDDIPLAPIGLQYRALPLCM